jgi:hypothetical protein
MPVHGVIDARRDTALLRLTPGDNQEHYQHMASEARGPTRHGTFLLALRITILASNFNVFDPDRKPKMRAAPPLAPLLQVP